MFVNSISVKVVKKQIFVKLVEICANRCRILRLKCTTLANSLSAEAQPQTQLGELKAPPRPLAVFEGRISKRRKVKGKGEGREGKGGIWPTHKICRGAPYELPGLIKKLPVNAER